VAGSPAANTYSGRVQLPFQKLNDRDQQGEKNQGNIQKLSHNPAPRVSQFSEQNPVQYSVRINVWDNHCIVHKRVDDKFPGKRVFRHISLGADEAPAYRAA